METQVLGALGSRLMDPALAKVLVRDFARAWNRLAAEAAGARTEPAAVKRKIVEAPADGVMSGSTKVAEFKRRADVLAAAPPGRPRLRPGLAEIHCDRAPRIRHVGAGDQSAEALEAARALIDKVIVSGPPDGGGPPRIELIDDLPELLKAAEALPDPTIKVEWSAIYVRVPVRRQGTREGRALPISR